MGDNIPTLQPRSVKTMQEMARGRNGGAPLDAGKLARLEKLDEWQTDYGLKMFYIPAEDQTMFKIGRTVVAQVDHWTLWPSDATIAQIALAIMSGVSEDKENGNLPPY